MLKLASLGMFSFSLGQTVLCIGRNKTSCESYGYNACEYQVRSGRPGASQQSLTVSSWRRSCHTMACPQGARCTTLRMFFSSPGLGVLCYSPVYPKVKCDCTETHLRHQSAATPPPASSG